MVKGWHWQFNPRARTLFALVTVAGIGLLIALVALLHSSLTVITTKTNEIDAHRAHESVQAAIDSAQNTINAVLVDNGVWDNATDHTYGPSVDPKWLYLNWGADSNDDHAYDGSFVLDENGHLLWGYFRDKPFTGKDTQVFGAGFNALLKAHMGELAKGGDPVVGLTRTAYGDAVVGIILIRPVTHALKASAGQRRYLVMTRHITATTLANMAKTFRLDGLRLSNTVPTSGTFVPLVGGDGQPIGALAWQLRLPGVEAARAAAPRIQIITLFAGLLILLFVGVSGYRLYKLAKSEREARRIALTDGLSGLPNRRALFDRLARIRHHRGPAHKTVVVVDLDGFKDVNDLHGHDTGDKLIVAVANALKAWVPATSILARIGGDEFALLISGRDGAARGEAFATSVLDWLQAPVRIGDRTITVGASIGIASGDLKTCSSQELFRRVDMAMSHGKSHGKGCVTVYDTALDAERLRKAEIEAGIRDGLARGEFDVAYQPIIDAQSGDMTGVEALVRWPRRPQGPLFPDQFIDIAEASGLIHPLGQFVLHKACADIGPVAGLKLSVNISPAQFRDPAFEAKVAAVLRETGFPTDRLELEVTEGYLIENPERAISAIANLKALGVSISLDDFGTGYSSIGYLRRYTFDKIKIDKSLAGRVDRDAEAAALVAGTVAIANALGLQVTAEGVETEDHVRLLKLAGCHNLQGYYFSKPKPLADILDLRDQWAKAS